MGENPTTSTSLTASYSGSLPPGCRFYPSDDQLLSYYLTSKNGFTKVNGIDVIKEVNLYSFDPFNLPDSACFRFGRGARRRHWYCYVARVLRERGKRRAGCGYWKRRGRVRDVVGGGAGKAVVGTRKCFVFYLGDEEAKTAVRTDWFMYEYALIDHPKASFVLCRVFVRSQHVNNRSEHVLSSCAEESVATVRHIGVQYDQTVSSAGPDAKTYDDKSADCDNKGLKFPSRLSRELDDRANIPPVAEQMNEALTDQELLAILEEDFIELDDLLCPLQGVD